jgi:hypothetical protein
MGASMLAALTFMAEQYRNVHMGHQPPLQAAALPSVTDLVAALREEVVANGVPSLPVLVYVE